MGEASGRSGRLKMKVPRLSEVPGTTPEAYKNLKEKSIESESEKVRPGPRLERSSFASFGTLQGGSMLISSPTNQIHSFSLSGFCWLLSLIGCSSAESIGSACGR